MSTAGTLNRCHLRARETLDELMNYCWEPALSVARANTVEMGGAARSARSNHSWDHVIERLLVLQDLQIPLIDPSSDDTVSTRMM